MQGNLETIMAYEGDETCLREDYPPFLPADDTKEKEQKEERTEEKTHIFDQKGIGNDRNRRPGDI